MVTCVRRVVYSLIVALFLCASPFFVQAALTTGETSCTAAQPCGTGNKKITFYIPIATPNCRTSVQGCIETSRVGLNGRNDPITVDAVRLKKAQYATCASDSSNYGKYFNMGTITYRSALDMQMYTVPNVICYVHDTGGAFRGRPDKLDLATTICPTCTDAQAMLLASGSTVNLFGQGPVDVNANAAIFKAALANMRGESPYTIGSSYTNVGGASPYTVGFPATGGYPTYGSPGGQVYNQDYYCVTSLEPIIVVPVPAGTPMPSNCYNNQSSQQRPPPPPPPPQQPQASPYQSQPLPSNPLSNSILSQQFLPQSDGGQTLPPLPPKPAATLIAQPAVVSKGNTILIAWSSVGMKTDGCTLRSNDVFLAQKNEGTKVIPGSGQSLGVMTFQLTCTPLSGLPIEKSASVTITNP